MNGLITFNKNSILHYITILKPIAISSSLLECSAERRWILCKDTARFPSMQWNADRHFSQSYITTYSPADLADIRRQTPRTTLATNCLFLRNNAACCIPLRDLRHLRENNTQAYSSNIPRRNPRSLSQIPQIIADKPQKNKPQSHINQANCLSLRNNVACCIPYLRDLRNLRENIHIRVLKQFPHRGSPIYLPLITQSYADKPQAHTISENHKQ